MNRIDFTIKAGSTSRKIIVPFRVARLTLPLDGGEIVDGVLTGEVTGAATPAYPAQIYYWTHIGHLDSPHLYIMYTRDDQGDTPAASVVLASMTRGGAWASGGLVAKDEDLALYEFGLPNAALATGSKSVDFYFHDENGLQLCHAHIELVAYDPLDAKLGTGLTITSGKVDVNDKTGFKLASDGLDSINATASSGVATNFREMIVQLWRRFFKKSTLTATELKTYADNGSTVVTTQAVSDDGASQTQGAAT